MRTRLFITMLGVGATAGGCKWTDFDDLADQTWVRSTEAPDVGSSDYPVALAGVSPGAEGGVLAVVSDEAPAYSTIEYNASGSATPAAAAFQLTSDRIGTVAEFPVFVGSAGKVALAERSTNGGNFTVYIGDVNGPTSMELQSPVPTPAPEAGLFVGDDFVFGAAGTLYTVPAAGGDPVACALVDDAASAVEIAALTADAMADRLLVWSKSGRLYDYALSGLVPCTDGTLAPQSTTVYDAGFMPSSGARAYLVGRHAILVGVPAGDRVGQAVVFDVSMTDTTALSQLSVDGLKSSAVIAMGGAPYLVVGTPQREVDGVVAGAVDVHAIGADGQLDPLPTFTLHDAQAESGQQFGRALTTMAFNGNEILVVGARAEVFAYFQTALYDYLP